MKTILNYSGILVILLVVTICSCKKTPPATEFPTLPSWHIKSRHPQTFLNSVYFTDAKTGYTVGGLLGTYGSILHGTILKTTDGGASWTDLSNDSLQFLTSVFFTDSLTGYVIGTNSILKTTNAGGTWTTVFKQSGVFPETIFFADKNTGYVVGTSGEILKTTDGGQHWVFQNSGTRCQLVSLYFTDPENGCIVGYMNQTDHSYGIILRTTNGGTKWDSIPFTGSAMPSSVVFTTPMIGYATGGNTILKTMDGGLNWTINYCSIPDYYNYCSFPNNPTGFVVGQNGIILKTSDAGQSWAILSSGTNSALASSFFVNSSIGYAVGYDQAASGGIILKWE
jgi:photosystem II stability/assembly factor-like uncharacterized protein